MMDSYLGQLMDEAFALDDAAKQRFERFERQQVRAQRRVQMVRKTYTPQPAQQPSTAGTVDTAAWNSWFEQSFANAVGHYDKFLKKALARVFVEERVSMRKALREEFQRDLGLLRAEILEQHKAGGSEVISGNTLPIRARNVTAVRSH